MLVLSLFLLLLSLFSSSLALTADIFISPLSSASSPSPLARISYDPSTLKSSLLSYSPPSSSKSTPQDTDVSLLRIGVLSPGAPDQISAPSSGSLWTASLTDSAALTPSADRTPLLRLFVGSKGDVYHVSVSGSSTPARNATEGISSPIVEIVKNEPGPRPQLNRPVVLGPDGKTDEPVEKTFLQKYWWVFLLITFFAMSGSAEGQ